MWGDPPYLTNTESRSSRDDLIRLGVDPRRIVLIPPGVDHELFRPGPKTSFPSIVYFGGMRRYKRPRDALLAFALVRREIPEARLYVMGEGPELPQPAVLVHGYPLGPAVQRILRIIRTHTAEFRAPS